MHVQCRKGVSAVPQEHSQSLVPLLSYRTKRLGSSAMGHRFLVQKAGKEGPCGRGTLKAKRCGLPSQPCVTDLRPEWHLRRHGGWLIDEIFNPTCLGYFGSWMVK